MMSKLTTPVALIVFNRPDTTKKVFEAIRLAKPPKLLVIADGARSDRAGEAEKCQQVRDIIDGVDWDCEVLKNYADINLGCGIRPATGIDWVFKNVEEAIILEDDCLPHPTFFKYCEELLIRYRSDPRVMLIGGMNPLVELSSKPYSYYFSHFAGTWGWASWRRAWKFYDYEMKLFPEALKAQFLNNISSHPSHRLYWQNLFKESFNDRNKTHWDYQWLFARWVQNGLGIIPTVNLISNIGFGVDATHTFGDSPMAKLEVKELIFPLYHPPFLIRDIELDEITNTNFYNPDRSLFKRIKSKFNSIKLLGK